MFFWGAILGLCCCVWAFSNCSESSSGRAQASHCSRFSRGAQALGHAAFVPVAHRLCFSMPRGIFLSQGLNSCFLRGGQIACDWATRNTLHKIPLGEADLKSRRTYIWSQQWLTNLSLGDTKQNFYFYLFTSLFFLSFFLLVNLYFFLNESDFLKNTFYKFKRTTLCLIFPFL